MKKIALAVAALFLAGNLGLSLAQAAEEHPGQEHAGTPAAEKSGEKQEHAGSAVKEEKKEHAGTAVKEEKKEEHPGTAATQQPAEKKVN